MRYFNMTVSYIVAHFHCESETFHLWISGTQFDLFVYLSLKHLEQGDTQGEFFEDEDEEDYVSLAHCDDNLDVMDC